MTNAQRRMTKHAYLAPAAAAVWHSSLGIRHSFVIWNSEFVLTPEAARPTHPAAAARPRRTGAAAARGRTPPPAAPPPCATCARDVLPPPGGAPTAARRGQPRPAAASRAAP